MATPEPVNIRADRMTARFNPPVISVNGFDLRDGIPADIPLQVLVEKPFDIFTQGSIRVLYANTRALDKQNRIKQMRQNQEVFATDHNQFQDRLSGIDGLSPE